jgi:uncharacterized peroxidase-related enzyme
MAARISTIEQAAANSRVQELYAGIKAKMGMVPKMMKTMAHSPATLEGYLALSGALAKGVLPVKIREQLALAVSQANGCDYCLAAHSVMAKLAGLKPEQVTDARLGKSQDPKSQATLHLAHNLLERRGNVSDEQLAAARNAGLSDAELVEVVGVVAMMVMTNFMNQLAHTDVDFPRAAPL